MSGRGPFAARSEDLTTALTGRLSGRLGDVMPQAMVTDLMTRARSMGARDPLEELLRWLETPPPFAEEFNVCQSLTLAASAVQTEVVGYAIPPGNWGVLRFIGVDTGNASDAPNVTFALQKNMHAVGGYAAVVGLLTSGGCQDPLALIKPVAGNDYLRWVATNATTSSIQSVRARLRGWSWASGTAPK